MVAQNTAAAAAASPAARFEAEVRMWVHPEEVEVRCLLVP